MTSSNDCWVLLVTEAYAELMRPLTLLGLREKLRLVGKNTEGTFPRLTMSFVSDRIKATINPGLPNELQELRLLVSNTRNLIFDPNFRLVESGAFNHFISDLDRNRY